MFSIVYSIYSIMLLNAGRILHRHCAKTPIKGSERTVRVGAVQAYKTTSPKGAYMKFRGIWKFKVPCLLKPLSGGSLVIRLVQAMLRLANISFLAPNGCCNRFCLRVGALSQTYYVSSSRDVHYLLANISYLIRRC